MNAKTVSAAESQQTAVPVGVLVLAWLIPGAGHLLLRRWGRGALLLGSIGLMFALGLVMGGRFFTLAPDNPVETLGFLGDLGSGLLFIAARFLGYDAPVVAAPSADYGTKFLLVAGLLNVLCILDAFDIGTGRKP